MQAHAQIIDRILDSTRALQRVLRAEPQLATIDVLLDQAVALARRALGASAPRIRIRHDGRPFALEVDAPRLQRAIANVIVNAARFVRAEDVVVVDTWVSPAGADVRIAQGGGNIDPRALGGTEHAGAARPLDLQMALARQLVELQGARMLLRAAAGGQPSLVIRLPAHAVRRSASAARTCGATRPELQKRLDGVHVLLVEDDPDALEFLALILRQAGATVSAFPLAMPAYDFLVSQKRAPDIIVSDIAMPVEDGYSLLRRVRAWESAHARIPVPAVAVSALSRDEDIQRALAHGFDRHMGKPVDTAALIDLIASWNPLRH